MRPLLAPIVLAVLASSVATPVAAAADHPAQERFADVEDGRYFTDAVEWAHGAGVVNGVTEQCFAPDRSATRGEVAAILQRLLAPDAELSHHPFADVSAGWQQVPVAWMSASGITNGTGPAEFSPDRAATRAMIAAFLWRIEGRPSSDASHPFSDVRSDWQQGPVAWMWATQITTGRTPTAFGPDEAVTRGELMTFVWRWQGRPEPAGDLIAPEPMNCLVETGTCADIFNPAAVAGIRTVADGRRVTAHVHDHRTDCTYELDPGLQITTASVIKAQVLAGVLLRAQDRGEPVSAADRARLELMLHYSHNSPPTSELYLGLGGVTGMETLDGRFGIAGTTHTGRYGATVSTAADRTRLVEQLLIGGGPLDPSRVREAWVWMSGVSVAQSWGVTAGLPSDHDFALKNGFYPVSGRGWRLGTTGAVRTPDGGAYALTILTDGNGDEASGIALVETVARLINRHLTVGAPADRPLDRIPCVTTSGADSWASAGARLAVGDLDELRRVNGGESAPLSGQRVCTP